MLGERFSAVDIYLFMLTTWLSPAHNHPTVNAFANVDCVAAAVAQRPSVRLVYETVEDVTLSRTLNVATQAKTTQSIIFTGFLQPPA